MNAGSKSSASNRSQRSGPSMSIGERPSWVRTDIVVTVVRAGDSYRYEHTPKAYQQLLLQAVDAFTSTGQTLTLPPASAAAPVPPSSP